MPTISNLLYINSENLIAIADLKDIIDDSYVNDATVKASVCFNTIETIKAGPAVDKGGGLVGIPCTDQPYATGDVIRFAETINYSVSEYTVHVDSSTNEIVITETFEAETFAGVEDIYLAIGDGDDITLGYVADSDGEYQEVLSNSAKLVENENYYVIIIVTYGTIQLMCRVKAKAVYYSG